ncbi:hypothetical protein EDC04DRAFT_2911668 [Pisolithus marmoratus]|nr:hypothetical protein EDC04DRAFT_2911668 [Pisolithus marmoratus]
MSLSGRSQSALAGLDDSDYEDSTNTQISVPSALSKSQLGFEQALKNAQLQLDVEWTCNHELKEKNAVLEANKPQHSKKNVLPKLLAYDSEIKMLAKKYGITTKLFFPCTPMMNAVSQSSPVNTLSFSSADHYTTIHTEELCLVAELDAILPKHLHHVQNMNSFHDLVHNFDYLIVDYIADEAIKFAQGMQSGRSDILYKLRDNADQIFDLPKVHFVPSFPRLEVPEIVKMLGVKDNMKVDMRKPFMNWHPLGQILKAALWGKVSLAEGFVWHSGPKTNG